MKRFVIFAFAALFLSQSAPARGDDGPAPARESRTETLRTGRLWHLAGLPAWFFAWISVHEGSHVLMAKAYGYEVVGFYPYPVKYEGKYYYGLTAFNKCAEGHTILLDDGRTVPCEENGGGAMIAIAPYLTDIAVFGTADLLLTTGAVNPDSFGGGMLYIGAMLIPWIDFTWNMNIPNDLDREIFQQETGMSRKRVVLLSEVVSAVGIWRLYVNGKRVFYDRDAPKQELGGVMLSPMSSEDALGLTLSGRW